MCGRFALRTSVPEIARILGIETPVPELAPRYNIAPTAQVPVCLALPDGERRLALMRWGLVPGWAKDERIGARMINARAETVASKPAFRAAFRRRRCLVPADGYYEWRRAGARKQPMYISLRDGSPLLMAGIWERFTRPDATTVETFAVITTGANELTAEVHDRMPVLLPESAVPTWIDPAVTTPEALAPLLVPFPSEAMAYYPVSTFVNNARNDDPRCIERLVEPPVS